MQIIKGIGVNKSELSKVNYGEIKRVKSDQRRNIKE